jgi:putative restriction endonuclease
MQKDLSFYCHKFTKLRVDNAHGVAPHKPTLLLSIIELFEQNKIERNQIYLSPELIATFLKYWSNLVTSEHRSDIALPFFHLTGDKFWYLMPNPGFEATITTRTKIKGLAAIRNAVKYAYVDDELFEYLQDAGARVQLAEALIQKWFPAKAQQYDQLHQVDELQNIQLRLFEKGGATYTATDLKDQDKAFVRNAAFRRIVVSLYEQRCAFCRLKIVSQNSQDIVDGAHIKPFSEFRDDRFDNGLALCKNHHWAFDRGWFGIDDNYRIVVPHNRFYEETPDGVRSMRNFDGEIILLPNQEIYNPRIESLHWHRNFWKIA